MRKVDAGYGKNDLFSNRSLQDFWAAMYVTGCLSGATG